MSLKEKRELQELIRLAYVAITRAIKKCFLTGGVKLDKDDVLSRPTSGSLFSTIFETIKNQIEIVQCNTELKDVEFIRPQVSLIHAPSRCSLPEVNILAAHKDKEQLTTNKKPTSWVAGVARIEGVVIHSLIERINKDGVNNWNEARVKQWSQVMMSAFKELGMPKQNIVSSVLNVNKRVSQLFHCSTFMYLAGEHEVDDVEFPVTLKKGPKLLNLQIDKGFIDQQGRAHLVDWKSAVCKNNEEVFMKMQSARHHEKMRQYATAYGEVRDVSDVNSQLYLTDINKLSKCG